MFDPKALLDQFLGGGRSIKGKLDQYSGSGGFMRGAATGSLLTLLLGGRGGGLMRYGGAAALGALALKAYQNYQAGKSPGSTTALAPDQIAGLTAEELPHSQPAADGSPFQLVLIRAMVGAAKADGQVDAAEQQKLFGEVERLGLESEAKAYVFDLLAKPVDLESITGAVSSPQQGAEVYLAARLAIDPDLPAERAYLDALASRLKLPAELRGHLDSQADARG